MLIERAKVNKGKCLLQNVYIHEREHNTLSNPPSGVSRKLILGDSIGTVE